MSQIKTITDQILIRDFLFDDLELLDRISDDYTKELTSKPDYDTNNALWAGFFNDGVCKALISFTPATSIAFNIHIMVPKKFRGKQSFAMCSEIIKHVENICDKRYININAIVPVIYKDVSRFLGKLGFNPWGVEKNSFLKNGNMYDRVHYTKKIGESIGTMG